MHFVFTFVIDSNINTPQHVAASEATRLGTYLFNKFPKIAIPF